MQNSENKKIEARSSGTHSSENLHDLSSLFSSGDNEVAKGNLIHRPGSEQRRD